MVGRFVPLFQPWFQHPFQLPTTWRFGLVVWCLRGGFPSFPLQRPGVLFQIKASHPNQGLLDHCPSDLLLFPLTGSQSAKPPVGAKFGLEGVIVRKQSLGSFKCSTEIHVSTMKRASSSPQEVLVGAALFLSRWLNWILPWSRLKKRRLTLARIGTLNPNQPSRNLGCFALERSRPLPLPPRAASSRPSAPALCDP